MSRLFVIICVCCFGFANAQKRDFFIFEENEVYSLFNFMETAAKMPGTSSTYQEFIDGKLSGDTDFKKAVQDFRSVNFNEGITRHDYPRGRSYRKSYLTLLITNAVKSKDLEDFNERITGILPMNEQLQMYHSLKIAQPYFRKFVWNENQSKVRSQIDQLKKYNEVNAQLFLKFNQFYKSSWDKEIPFYVVLYPIPGKNGTTTATPHGNALCIGSLTDANDTVGTLGVTLHEMCHILYNEQSKNIQLEFENYFKQNQSQYSKLAYSYFNEAMATVLGNGYAYKIINNNILDKQDWYNNKTINLFAKAIYPLTEKYLKANRSIDKNFIDEVVKKFQETFPDSIYEYAPNFNTLNIYTEQLNSNDIFDNFFSYFDANSIGISSPYKNVSQSSKLSEEESSFLMLIDTHHQENFEELKKAFPEIRNIKYNSSVQNISFYDAKNRMIVILFISKKEDLNAAFEKLAEYREIDKTKLIQY
ncbi:hypothetical protein PGH12_08340 [Chryseobacterium wangxinyae]|uniref:hypothetical protein n=1 Tax=Chryseobacterium sp. CY350 TaxID=2997336 RepID=UPI00226E7878|nr:hypothetical protein [Chryseobacterium sp. CY350]MCY0979355.1 hypothetical protein [Chryseobacterium sp. CY350]WBZ97147.1 hypothetical protein PGH12_08340 [Chryseobacterium sp. CY350]